MDEPEAADHGEADRVGEEVFALVPERVVESAPSVRPGSIAEVQHQQRDRDREDPVAEGDDPRELDLVLLPPLRASAPCATAPIIAARPRRNRGADPS